MIRTIAALAALVALPAIASAQPADSAAHPVGEITVYGHANVYRIVLSTTGKSKTQVYHEIAKAADEACSKVNEGDLSSVLTSDGLATCVTQARNDAERQYDENRTDWYREVGYDTYRAPIVDADQ